MIGVNYFSIKLEEKGEFVDGKLAIATNLDILCGIIIYNIKYVFGLGFLSGRSS